MAREICERAGLRGDETAGELTDEGQHERGDEGAEERHEGGLQQGIRPPVGQQAHRHGREDDQQREAAQAEKLAYQQVPGPETELAGGVADDLIRLHGVGIAQEAHVLLPVEEVGEGCDEDEQGQRRDAQSDDAHGSRPLLFVPGFPESHFFLYGLL